MYDAIVIGARCAGSPTAMLLARRGSWYGMAGVPGYLRIMAAATEAETPQARTI